MGAQSEGDGEGAGGGRGGNREDTGELRPGLLQVDGLPLIKPPYGRVTCIDLEKGDIAWQVAHGETPDAVRNHPALKGVKIPRTGQIGRGAGVVTKTLFIMGDTGPFTDPNGRRGARLRAYDKATGEEKGAVYLPAQQTGSPISFMLGGRQYVVLAVAGTGAGAELVALRLPNSVA
jgi:quinoprotein glucose dehydrogenase